MRALLRAADWLDWLNDGIGRAVGWLAALLVIVGVVNVVGRYAGSFLGMQLSSNSLLEAQTYLYSLIFLLGAAH
ncbi:MAG: C4-dicarboxylate ABC transporter substrate-binding protein, partial [Ectothiorhodospiraceae bacterium]